MNSINIINIINYHYLLLNLVSTGILPVFFFFSEAHRGGFGGREVVRRERGAGALETLQICETCDVGHF